MSDGIKRTIVNSSQTLIDADNLLLEMYKEHRHLTITIRPGVARSQKQNRLQRKWIKEAAAQGDQTEEEYRGFCKLHFGVPIRREEDDYREVYDKVIRPLSYEDKLKAMMVPLDMPVTRDMTTKQKTRYLDEVYKHFTSLGFKLTEPEQ